TRQRAPMRRLCKMMLQPVALVIACVFGTGLSAFSPDLSQSVLSVLPVWPGQSQGGAGQRPGLAPEGSGVVIAPGVIATAWHVVEPAERIDVRLPDGRILPAELIAADAATDIAILSVNAGLPAVTLAVDPTLGEPVCAVGNAFGLGVSISCGVVSATGISNAGFNPVEDFVQTDAAINPGMSGGGLFDRDGHLVGMVSAIFASEGDGNIGVNFAVSGPLLTRVTRALEQDGAVRFPDPGWSLGVADRATRARIAAPVIDGLDPQSAAAAAGLAPGDLLLEVAGRRVKTPRDAVAALALVPQEAGEYDVLIERDGQVQSLPVVFRSSGEEPLARPAGPLGDCPHPDPVCLMRQAVFPVSSFDPVGSATRIGPDLLVTNRHVVGDRSDAVVHTPDGPRGARVIASAYAGDLALLQVPDLPDAGFIPDLVDTPLGAEGFYVVGADITREEMRVFDPGDLIARPAEGAELGRIHVTSRMQPGVSGGALVNAQGDLVGIAVGGGESRFEAIPLVDVRELLALTEETGAVERTETLGRAFAECAGALDQARSRAAEQMDPVTLTQPCVRGDNHGQLLEAGRLLARAGAFDEGALLHAAAVAQVPNSINARLSLLVSLQLGARFEDMVPHARWLMDMAPGDPQALRFAIQSGVWGNDPDLAEAGYEKLLAADPVQAQAARRFIDSAPPAPARR
ncbi:MAG: trypsin-like peptidase domain-containing protein, partial [Pseudomonadota bacterium]